jgi:hypothetical protein
MGLCSLTLPGLDVKYEWRALHDRLLDDFPTIEDVLPTTMRGTLLIVHRGTANVDSWLDSINQAILGRRLMSRVRAEKPES